MSKALTLISRFTGSYLKDALCRLFHGLTKDVQPHYLLLKGSNGPNNKLGRRFKHRQATGTK